MAKRNMRLRLINLPVPMRESAEEGDDQRVLLSYTSPNDPRLPDEVKQLPIGKREDWVWSFNFSFFFYDKKEDADYDENEPWDVNAIRWATARAWDAIGGQTATGENLEGDTSEEEKSAEEDALALFKEYADKGFERIVERLALETGEFVESEDGGFRTEITVIQEGWSLNGHYYGPEVIRQIAEQANDQFRGILTTAIGVAIRGIGR